MALFVLLAVSVPVMALAPKSIAAFSVMATFVPVKAKELNVFEASSRVISPVPEFKVVAPVTATVPLSVIALLVLLTVNVPAAVLPPKSVAEVFVTLTLLPVKFKLPVKLLPAFASVISPVVL